MSVYSRDYESESEKLKSNNVELGGWGLMNMPVDTLTVAHYPFYVKLHRITFVIINGCTAVSWNVKSIKTYFHCVE